jgi:hypothetical protein
MAKDVAKKTEDKLPATIDYAKYAGAGMENTTAEDYAIPFLSVLQDLSPQCKETKAEYIEGAKPGMIFNSVTHDMWEPGKSLIIIPCVYKREMIEWKKKQGGFVKNHGNDFAIIETAEYNEDLACFLLPNGNQINDTRQHYVVVFDPESGEIFQALMSMTSTQMKKSKRWNSLINGRKLTLPDGKKVNAPSFSCAYEVHAIPESNDQGSWYGWSINIEGNVTDENLFNESVALWEAAKAGDIKVDGMTDADVETDAAAAE